MYCTDIGRITFKKKILGSEYKGGGQDEVLKEEISSRDGRYLLLHKFESMCGLAEKCRTHDH